MVTALPLPFHSSYTVCFAVVEAVQLAPAQKKPTLATLVDGVSLEDNEESAEASGENTGQGAKAGTRKRRLFKRLEVDSGNKLSVKAMMAASGSGKRSDKRSNASTKSKQDARHTLLQSARYQAQVGDLTGQ